MTGSNMELLSCGEGKKDRMEMLLARKLMAVESFPCNEFSFVPDCNIDTADGQDISL